MKTSNNNTIDIIMSFETNALSKNLSLTIGALSVTLDLCKLENTIDVLYFIIDKYDLPNSLDKEDITTAITELSQLEDIMKCEMLYQHLQFNTKTGELTIIENIIRGCSLNVFKYIDKIQSFFNS